MAVETTAGLVRVASAEPARADIMKSKVEEVYQNLLPPGPQEVIAGVRSVDHLFAPDVRGRVTPLGQFPGFEAAREYFYGLATTPGVSVTGFRFKSLAVEGDLAAVKVDIDFDATGTPVGQRFTLTHIGFFTFDGSDRIASFDLVLPNLGAAVNPRSKLEKSLRIVGVCAQMTLGGLNDAAPSCPGEFDGDNSTARFLDCVSFMLRIPFGSYDRANSNTFVCRELHSLMTPIRPEIHCPHSGKTGGMTCVDMPYDSYYEQDF